MTYCGKRQSLEAHQIGLVGELATAQWFGVDVDHEIYQHGDNGIDLNLPILGKTAVKSTTYKDNPWLRAEVEHDKPSIQSYLLAYVPDLTEGWLVGFCPRSTVISKRPRKLVVNGPDNYVVEPKDLQPVPCRCNWNTVSYFLNPGQFSRCYTCGRVERCTV